MAANFPAAIRQKVPWRSWDGHRSGRNGRAPRWASRTAMPVVVHPYGGSHGEKKKPGGPARQPPISVEEVHTITGKHLRHPTSGFGPRRPASPPHRRFAAVDRGQQAEINHQLHSLGAGDKNSRWRHPYVTSKKKKRNYDSNTWVTGIEAQGCAFRHKPVVRGASPGALTPGGSARRRPDPARRLRRRRQSRSNAPGLTRAHSEREATDHGSGGRGGHLCPPRIRPELAGAPFSPFAPVPGAPGC